MAGAGYKLFVSGDVLTAAQVNTYLNEQTVMVFATSAARTSALSAVLAEGMMSYLQDSNTVFFYDGAAWNALASGDITAITAGNGITVTSGTGPVPTVEIDTSVTVDKTTAQTLTNKTLTSPALTTPTISTLTTNGDLVYGTGSGALSRLGIGSSAQVLTVASGIPSWSTPAGGGGMTLISSTVPSGASSVNFTSISGSYKHLLVLWTAIHTSGSGVWDYRFNNSSGANYFSSYISNTGTTLTSINLFDGTSATDPSAPLFDIGDSQTSNATGSRGYLWIYDYADTTYDKVYVGGSYYYGSNQHFITEVKGLWDQAAAITSVDIVKLSGTSTMTAASRGIIRLYGVS